MRSLLVKLVYPGLPRDPSIPDVTEHTWISHGLCFLSACAKAAGHRTELIDLRAVPSRETLADSLRAEKPDVVAITMLSVHYDNAMDVAKLAKESCPSTVTVVGGPHPSIMPEECLENPHVDTVVRGEGETSFVEILDTVARGGTPERLVEGRRPDLDKLPIPDRGLFPALEVVFSQELRLVESRYALSFGVAEMREHGVRLLDHRYDVAQIEVKGGGTALGQANLGSRISWRRVD